MTQELRSLFVENAPEGYVKMFKAMNLLGVSHKLTVAAAMHDLSTGVVSWLA